MDFGLVALGLLIAAFAVQIVVVALAGAFGRPLADLDFLPYVEFGLIASAVVVAAVGRGEDGNGLLETTFWVSLGLLAAFLLLQLLRALAIASVFRKTQARMPVAEAVDGDAPLDDAPLDQRQERGGDVGENVDDIREDPSVPCRIRQTDDLRDDPKSVMGFSLPFLGTAYLYVLSVQTAVTIDSPSDPRSAEVEITATSTGSAIPYTTLLKAGISVVAGWLRPVTRPGTDERQLLDLLAGLGIEIEAGPEATSTAKGAARCAPGPDGKCIVLATALVTPPANVDEFSAAAIINVKPKQAGGGVPDLTFPNEVEFHCEGLAAFKGELVVEKVTVGGSAGVQLGAEPAKLTLGGKAEVVIRPNEVEQRLPGGRLLGFQCARFIRTA
jgi:hypothetical protein